MDRRTRGKPKRNDKDAGRYTAPHGGTNTAIVVDRYLTFFVRFLVDPKKLIYIFIFTAFVYVFYGIIYPWVHGRTGRKKVGGRKEKCPTFRDSAQLVPKKFFRRNYFGDGGGGGGGRQKNFGQCTILGVKKIFRTNNTFRNITRIFEKSLNLLTNLLNFSQN
jgi:hypothetical protein